MGTRRVDVFFEKHFGIGIRWRRFYYAFELSISIPFVTITLGLGPEC